MEMSQEIRKLFKIRDEAVSKKNKTLFLSTQIDEIAGSSSEGYLGVDKLRSEILYSSLEGSPGLSAVVFVKETYYLKGKKSQQGFLIYFIANTIKRWKIYRIVY